MNSVKNIPNQILKKINESHEDILFCITYDLDSMNNFIEEFVIITYENIFITYNNNIEIIPINKDYEYKAESYFGKGIFLIKDQCKRKLLCNFTMTYMKDFSLVTEGLNNIKYNIFIKPKINIESSNTCSKCKRMMPEYIKICPSCRKAKGLYKRFFKLGSKYMKSFIVTLILFFTISGLNLLRPVIQGNLTNNFIKAKTDDFSEFSNLIIKLLIVSLLIGFVEIIRRLITVKIKDNLANDIRNLVYKKIQNQTLSFINSRKTGDLFNRITKDANNITSTFVFRMPYAINNVIIIIFVFFILVFYNIKMALFLILPIPISVFIIFKIFRYIRSIFIKQYRQLDRVNSLLQDILSGIRVIKSFRQEKNTIQKFRLENENYKNLSIKNEIFFNTTYPIVNFLMSLGTYPIIYVGGNLVLENKMTVGELVMINQFALMIYSNLSSLSSIPRLIANSSTSIGRAFEIIESDIGIKNIKNPVKSLIKGEIKFIDVYFGYKPYIPVLKNININIKEGEMIGLVGHSGAGKSTLINLVMRLYDVNKGQILIDGKDIKNLSKDSYSSQIGVVLQETYLFSGTVIENIKYAKPVATLEEIILACKIANAHNFIIKLPNGYNTQIGEKGERFSGGEKQRIAIARAIISNPRLLILDEATSSLDTNSEYEVQEALEKVIKGRTTFVIAHRLSTLRKADRIIVFDKGVIKEIGTHKQLIENKSIYFNLIKVQS